MGWYCTTGKRCLDLLVAVPALVALSPVLLATALLTRVCLGTPVLFRQRRPGLHEKPFFVCKFRTMTDRRDSSGTLLPDAERLPAAGRWMRRLSLDELPQLWNVVRGDMGLVGPRPLLEQYLPLYNEEQRLRHTVRPGITGWAQVNGRNATTWDERFAQDIWYTRHVSLATDLRILAMTARKVLQRDGVSHAGHVTMPVFRGNQPAEVDG